MPLRGMAIQVDALTQPTQLRPTLGNELCQAPYGGDVTRKAMLSLRSPGAQDTSAVTRHTHHGACLREALMAAVWSSV